MNPSQQPNFNEMLRVQEQVAISRQMKASLIACMMLHDPSPDFLLELELQAMTLLNWVQGKKGAQNVVPAEPPGTDL